MYFATWIRERPIDISVHTLSPSQRAQSRALRPSLPRFSSRPTPSCCLRRCVDDPCAVTAKSPSVLHLPGTAPVARPTHSARQTRDWVAVQCASRLGAECSRGAGPPGRPPSRCPHRQTTRRQCRGSVRSTQWVRTAMGPVQALVMQQAMRKVELAVFRGDHLVVHRGARLIVFRGFHLVVRRVSHHVCPI